MTANRDACPTCRGTSAGWHDTKNRCPNVWHDKRDEAGEGQKATVAANGDSADPRRLTAPPSGRLDSRDALTERVERKMREALGVGTRGGPPFADWEQIVRQTAEVAVRMVEGVSNELERERVRLAGCGVAALGYVTELVPEYGDSASLQDVLRLRKRAEAAEKERDEWAARARALDKDVEGLIQECNQAQFDAARVTAVARKALADETAARQLADRHRVKAEDALTEARGKYEQAKRHVHRWWGTGDNCQCCSEPYPEHMREKR